MLAPALASAQSPPPAHAPQFLPRVGFGFGWSGLVASDVRFNWEGRIEFDFDIVDYGTGRLIFKGEYATVLGRERRLYDLNQGYYTFDVASTRRLGRTEIAATISHVSRHLVDRHNIPSISWNAAGVRVQYRNGGFEARADVARAMQQAFVDYVWMSRARVSMQHPINARSAIVGSASGDLVGINHLVRDRRVCGGRLEGGVRINGRTAAVEFFAGYERRIDAYPTDRFRVRMFSVGFRVLSK